jgi:hypothetical protein
MNPEPGISPADPEISDRLAILDILCTHSRGLDRLDPALLQSCYWHEAEVDYGSYKGPAHPFAELVIPALESQYELTRHCLSNSLVEFHGNQARVESYVNADHLLLDATEEMQFGGRYLDTLEKRDGQWKLLHRQVVMDWSRRLPVGDERNAEAFAELAKGGHRGEDPLTAFLQPA